MVIGIGSMATCMGDVSHVPRRRLSSARGSPGLVCTFKHPHFLSNDQSIIPTVADVVLFEMATLSTGANFTAFIGLLDIVFKYTVEASNLYSRCATASKSIPRLLEDLKLFADTIAQIRIFAVEYEQSPYVLEDSQVVLPQLKTLLQRSEQQLSSLKLMLNELTVSQGDGWFKKWNKNLSWGLDDQKILRSCQQLEAYKTSFNGILSLIGRKNDIVIRKQLKETRQDLKNIASTHTHTNSTLANIQSNMVSSSQNMQTGVDSITASMNKLQTSQNIVSTSIDGVESSLQSSNKHLENIRVGICGHATNLEQGLGRVKESIEKNYKQQFELFHQQEARLTSRLESAVASISITENLDHDILFYGENIGMIVLPLLLMKSDLIKCVRSLSLENKMTLSASEASWIEEEIENLLSCGLKSELGTARKARHTISELRKRNHDKSSDVHAFPSYAPEDITQSMTWRTSHERHSIMEQWYNLNRETDNRSYIKIPTAAGILTVEINSLNEQNSTLFGCRISILPKLTHASTSIVASFISQLQDNSLPKITRHLETQRVLPRSSEAIRAIENRDAVALRDLLRHGKVSIYDRDEVYGRTILEVCVRPLSLLATTLLAPEAESRE
ncbi:hypothetical protein NHQ30_001451 [Ciborinia camelliae]|nr:hypothetical protein NHQ30_001451 [Ciborinia camelliae]